MRDVVTPVDHGPVDEVFAVLDEQLLQEVRICAVDGRNWTAIPSQNFTSFSNRTSNLQKKKKFKMFHVFLLQILLISYPLFKRVSLQMKKAFNESSHFLVLRLQHCTHKIIDTPCPLSP